MAFAKSELSLMAYNGVAAGANHLWFYANSAEDDITAAGFFDDLLGTDGKPRVTDGDLIYSAPDTLGSLAVGGTAEEPTIVLTVLTVTAAPA